MKPNLINFKGKCEKSVQKLSPLKYQTDLEMNQDLSAKSKQKEPKTSQFPPIREDDQSYKSEFFHQNITKLSIFLTIPEMDSKILNINCETCDDIYDPLADTPNTDSNINFSQNNLSALPGSFSFANIPNSLSQNQKCVKGKKHKKKHRRRSMEYQRSPKKRYNQSQPNIQDVNPYVETNLELGAQVEYLKEMVRTLQHENRAKDHKMAQLFKENLDMKKQLRKQNKLVEAIVC